MAEFTSEGVRAAISTERMERYVAKCHGCEDNALSLYGFNMALCEAFYTPLQAVEVCLRNSLHDAMTKAFGSHWMTNGGPPLDCDATQQIDKAVANREQFGKATEPPDLVAEISFSFWVSLLGPRYDSTLWRTTLHSAFRAQPTNFKRKFCHGRFNAIRRFRNRIAHHEPILDSNPPQKHQEIIAAIEWISPDKSVWTLERSRVPVVTGEMQKFLGTLAKSA